MKIIFLDAKTIGDDIDLSVFEDFGEVIKYNYSTNKEVEKRVEEADIIIINKAIANAQTLKNAKRLKLVCVTATGTNNIDKEYLEANGILWRNVVDYSTLSVAQYTFTLLFALVGKINYFDNYVKSGNYANNLLFTHLDEKFFELNGKTWGIIGLGAIGKKVANIAEAFGVNVIYFSPTNQPQQDGYKRVDFDTLLQTSDIISIHTPLNEYTENLIDKEAFKKMKNSSILINVARGPIVNEDDLYEALQTNQISSAGLDVLKYEPMRKDNKLLEIQDSKKLIITPHIAWASVEARQKLINIVYSQIKEFLGKKS